MSLTKRFLFSLVSVALFFGALELILRLHDFAFYYNFNADLLGMPLLDLTRLRRVANPTVSFDPRVFWRFKPDQILSDPQVYRRPVVINNRGFRGTAFTAQKPDGVFRILCLGDSTTFGWSVADDETYPHELGILLNKRHPKGRFQVLNLGVTGYTSLQGRELFLGEAADYEPDLVLFAFGPNDRLPALRSDAEHLAAGTWKISSLQVALSRSQVYKLLRAGVIYLERRRQGLSLDSRTLLPRLKRKVSPEEFAANAAAVKQRAQELGADFILLNVDFPSLPMDHNYANLQQEAQTAGVPLSSAWRQWDTSQTAADLARELKVPLLDLRELFRQELDRRREGGGKLPDPEWSALMIDNGHPNAEGHRVIARSLVPLVESTARFQRYLEESP